MRRITRLGGALAAVGLAAGLTLAGTGDGVGHGGVLGVGWHATACWRCP